MRKRNKEKLNLETRISIGEVERVIYILVKEEKFLILVQKALASGFFGLSLGCMTTTITTQ